MSENDMIIVLHIQEGIALNFKNEQIMITATLHGNSMDTDLVQPGPTTYFNQNIIWMADRKSIKRMKTESCPIKLECFSVDCNADKSYIGYIILPIRAIPIVSAMKAANSKLHWHKLIGLSSEWKQQRPEISLFLTITDKHSFDLSDGNFKLNPQIMDNFEEQSLSDHSVSQDLNETGSSEFIQIGDDKGSSDVFMVEIVLGNVLNLDELLTSKDEINNNYKMQYIFNKKSVELNLTQITKEIFQINETIKLKFKSSPKKLYAHFLNDFFIPLIFFYNETAIGNLNLKFDLNGFLEQKSNSYEYESKSEINSLGKKAFIEYKLRLKKISSQEPVKNRVIQKQPRKIYSLNFVLKTVKFNNRPESGTWQISFHNSKADTPFTVKNVEITEINVDLIDFKELKLSLFFSAASDEISEIVNSEPCTLSVIGPKGVSLRADLDNENLLAGTSSENSGIIFMENLNGENAAIANVYVFLEDFGFNFNSRVRKVGQPKPYLDENLAYKVVEEFEMWKENQMKNFLVHLKRKETEHLAKLSSEWLKKRLVEENKLAEKMEECNQLTNSLEEAHKNMEKRSDQEEYLKQFKERIEHEYSVKSENFLENSKKFQDEMNHRFKLEELRFKEMEISKNVLERENEKFKVVIRDLESRISELQEVPKEQFLVLFEDLRKSNEKLEALQKSKNFYKEQWAKVLREHHKVKSSKGEREEMLLERNGNIGIQDYIDSERSELDLERDQLLEIKMSLSDNYSNFSLK